MRKYFWNNLNWKQNSTERRRWNKKFILWKIKCTKFADILSDAMLLFYAPWQVFLNQNFLKRTFSIYSFRIKVMFNSKQGTTFLNKFVLWRIFKRNVWKTLPLSQDFVANDSRLALTKSLIWTAVKNYESWFLNPFKIFS